jgi:hypothetical protein
MITYVRLMTLRRALRRREKNGQYFTLHDGTLGVAENPEQTVSFGLLLPRRGRLAPRARGFSEVGRAREGRARAGAFRVGARPRR